MPLPAGVLNGRIPLGFLARLPWDECDHLYLEVNAAASIGRVAARFEADFRRPLYLSDAYRTLTVQERLRVQKGPFAATPGTSNHGWGRAIDVASNVNNDRSPEHLWFERVAPEYGWVNPWWAVDNIPSNGMYEPWHWEYDEKRDKHLGEETIVALTDDDRRLLVEVRDRLRNLDRQVTGADTFTPSIGERIVALQGDVNTILQAINESEARVTAHVRAEAGSIPGAVWDHPLTSTDVGQTHPAREWFTRSFIRVRDLWDDLVERRK